MATHSSVLAWRIPGTGEPGGLLSMGSHGVRHDWCDSAAAAADWVWESAFWQKLQVMLMFLAQRDPLAPDTLSLGTPISGWAVVWVQVRSLEQHIPSQQQQQLLCARGCAERCMFNLISSSCQAHSVGFTSTTATFQWDNRRLREGTWALESDRSGVWFQFCHWTIVWALEQMAYLPEPLIHQ